ncbi:RNA 2'-phosphotransferase, partial [Proteus mirabilis]
MNQYDKISKFLSYVLRHQPDSVGIRLDNEGWTDIT